VRTVISAERFVYAVTKPTPASGSGPQHIASVPANKANAIIIAAAPWMFETLQSLRHRFNSGEPVPEAVKGLVHNFIQDIEEKLDAERGAKE
jgi:hypothetical protein